MNRLVGGQIETPTILYCTGIPNGVLQRPVHSLIPLSAFALSMNVARALWYVVHISAPRQLYHQIRKFDHDEVGNFLLRLFRRAQRRQNSRPREAASSLEPIAL